jgi:predicted amidohydrolase
MTLIIAAAQSTSIAGEIASNVVRHLRFGTIAADRGAQLLVFPELSLTGFEPGVARSNAVCAETPVLDSLRCLAGGAHMTVVVGAPMLNDSVELYIAALAIRPDGSTLIYTKEYLHPGEEHTFVPGSGGPAFKLGMRM